MNTRCSFAFYIEPLPSVRAPHTTRENVIVIGEIVIYNRINGVLFLCVVCIYVSVIFEIRRSIEIKRCDSENHIEIIL